MPMSPTQPPNWLTHVRSWHILALAAVFRAALICWADYQDTHLSVKYTDVDYVVFTDAARYVAGGSSPYRRATYRYSPLLAWLLLPNIWVHAAWGKVLFSTADLVAAALMSYLLRRTATPRPLRVAALAVWLFNPYTATISTRGSCDVLSVLLLLGLLVCLLHGKLVASGALYGLAVHFRIYPVIYGPAIALFLARREHATAGDVGRLGHGPEERRRGGQAGGDTGRASGCGDAAARSSGDCAEEAHEGTSPAPSARGSARRASGDGSSRSSTPARVSQAAESPAETRRRRTLAAVTARRDAARAAADVGDAAAVAVTGGGGGSVAAATARAAGAAGGARGGAGAGLASSCVAAALRGAAVLRPVALFSAAAAGTFLALGAGFYALYGKEFLHEAFVHHLTRKDPRHNFSPYYYPVYLSYGSGGGGWAGEGSYGGGYGSGGAWAASARSGGDRPLPLPPALVPSRADSDAANAAATAGVEVGLLVRVWTAVRRLVAGVPLAEPWRLALLPQATALLAVALRFHEDLPVAWMLQTWCFVTLNKVVTAQYFVWYLSLLPLALPALAAQRAVSWRALGGAAAGWVAAQLHWLAWAYQLEMLGRSVHVPLWVAGLLFQAANSALVALLMRALRRPLSWRLQRLQPQGGVQRGDACRIAGEGVGNVADGSSGKSGGGEARSAGIEGVRDSSYISGGRAQGGGGARVMSFLEASLALACPPPPAAIAAASKKRR